MRTTIELRTLINGDVMTDPERQTARHVLLIRPACFGSNSQTAGSNAFQQSVSLSPGDIQHQARLEFDQAVSLLQAAGLDVMVFDDLPEPATPDAVFPNNWISSHADGTVFLYPMEALNRRQERRTDIVEALSERYGFDIRQIIDLTRHEEAGEYLEGTGSMVLDRPGHFAYAALSSRTHAASLAEFAQRADYNVVVFEAVDSGGQPVYHTNVVMTIGEKFALICDAAIADADRRASVLAHLAETGREVIRISLPQMKSFAGNLLEMSTASGDAVIALSRRAYDALSANQLESLGRYGRLLPVPIDLIERVGGGSLRCMIAEVFLPHSPSNSEN
jgi:hypothetical protein